MSSSLLIPAFRRWPWVWFAPLVAYLILAATVPALRQSLRWFRFGHLSFAGILTTLLVIAFSAGGLLIFNRVARPDVQVYRATLRFNALGSVVRAGVIFSVLNATLEELVFRGVLFDAIESQWNAWVTLLATSLLFGLGHLHGYPPGVLGACLAVLFGLAMGMLKVWTGGLAMPIVAHIGADATIYYILAHGGIG